jgi:hypothetical protein
VVEGFDESNFNDIGNILAALIRHDNYDGFNSILSNIDVYNPITQYYHH